MDQLIKEVFEEIVITRDAGQKEYAHSTNNVFANFERVAQATDVSKEKVLLVYLLKHIDGIAAYVKGHESQRESVNGRIVDAIVYLFLLRGMVHDKTMQQARDSLDENN